MTTSDLYPQYVVNDMGQKMAVILPITEYVELLEDLQDLAVVVKRREEPTISHEALILELEMDDVLPD